MATCLPTALFISPSHLTPTKTNKRLPLHHPTPPSTKPPTQPTTTTQKKALVHLYKELADIEYHLAAGASEKLQLGALVGAFSHAREMLS